MQRPWSEGGFVTYPQPMEGEKMRVSGEAFDDHFSQATLFWRSQSTWEQEHIVAAFRFELGKFEVAAVRERMVSIMNNPAASYGVSQNSAS